MLLNVASAQDREQWCHESMDGGAGRRGTLYVGWMISISLTGNRIHTPEDERPRDQLRSSTYFQTVDNSIQALAEGYHKTHICSKVESCSVSLIDGQSKFALL